MDLDDLDSFRKQIADAQASIHSLYAIRRVVDERIDDLRDLVRANANFLPNQEREAELVALDMLKVPETITEAVKVALFIAAARKERLTPIQVRESAQARGFNFSSYTNPMASIHSVLKRMKDANPPEADFNEQTGTYAYISALPFDTADESFFHKLNATAWSRLISEEKEIADKYATGVIEQCLTQITRKPKRK